MANKHKPIGMSTMFAQASQSRNYTQLEERAESLEERNQQLEAEIAQLRASAGSLQEKAELEAKIQVLAAQLSQQYGEQDIPIQEICRNPFQPRTIFPAKELEAFANVLKQDGQNTPVILIPLSQEDKNLIWASSRHLIFDESVTEEDRRGKWEQIKFLLFDGERRWRSVQILNWETLRAVIKPNSDDLDLMSVQSDALCTTLHRQGLHPLNLAQVLIQQILYQHPQFDLKDGETPDQVIPRVLGNVLARLERQGKHAELREIVSALAPEQQVWLEGLGLKSFEERWILEVLLKYQLHPLSIDANVFPLLKLPPDLKGVVQETGLERSKVLEVAKLSAEKLGVHEDQAREARTKVVAQILSDDLSLSKIKTLVSQISNSYKQSSNDVELPIPPSVKKLQGIKVEKLERAELEQLSKAMRQKLKEIELVLKQTV